MDERFFTDDSMLMSGIDLEELAVSVFMAGVYLEN
jgi:hypothetical protein